MVCAADFALGYSLKRAFNEKAIAADEYNGTKIQNERFADIFPKDIYMCSYNYGTGSYAFIKKSSLAKSANGKEAYRRSDNTLSIMKKVLDYKYDIVLKESSEGCVMYEEAYRIGTEALYKKYGENTVLNATSDDCPYEVKYRPDLKMMCYCIREVNGYMNGKDGSFDVEVVFTLFVSVDGAYAQVASTLCY